MKIVPQYVDIEDHIVGPLTWKQLGWFGGGGFLLVILWQFLDESAFYTAAVPVIVLTAAFAFYKPQGIPLIKFVGFAILFAFKPRLYLWQREANVQAPVQAKPVEKQKIVYNKKPLDTDDISILAHTLDMRGSNHNDRLEEILRKRTDYQG
jgi:hypothetical protein